MREEDFYFSAGRTLLRRPDIGAARQRSPAGFGCGRAAVPRRWRKRQFRPTVRLWFEGCAAAQPYRVWLRQGGGAPPLAERQLRPTVRLWFEGCAAAQPCRVWLWQGGGAPPLAEQQLRPTVRLWFEGCAAAQPYRVWLWQGGGAPPLAERPLTFHFSATRQLRPTPAKRMGAIKKPRIAPGL